MDGSYSDVEVMNRSNRDSVTKTQKVTGETANGGKNARVDGLCDAREVCSVLASREPASIIL
jgi:hypothetical protein